MNLLIGDITVTSLEELRKTIRERQDDYRFVTKIVDLFVDGDLEDFVKTCHNAEKYAELLSAIDKGYIYDSELFKQIAEAFEIVAGVIQPNLTENYEFIGLRWDKFGNSDGFVNRESYCPETKKQDVFVGLKVKNPIMENIGLTMQIRDINRNVIRTIQSESCSLRVDKNSIVGIRFHVDAADFAQYRNVEIKQNEQTIHSFCTYPSSIRIKVRNVWFSMNSFWGRYEGQIPFLLWFALMPKTTTYRDERYTFYDVELREISGGSDYERTELVNQCVNRLRNFTGLKITLKRPISEKEREVAEWCGTINHYFNPNYEKSNIYINLSFDDYKEALIENNDCFIISDSRMGIIANDVQITSERCKSFIKEMLNN